MKKRTLSVLALCLLLALSGCGYVAERDYTVVAPYVEQQADAEDVSALRATNYAELLNSVQYFVTMGEEEGTIRLYQYTGDVAADLETACQEVVQNDPLGSYALTNITYSYSHIVTYYECTLTYLYRRTFDQIASIRRVSGTSGIRTAVAEALQSWQQELVLQTGTYYADQNEILTLIREAYYENPAYAIEAPNALVTVYQSTGATRIVEIEFEWSLPPEELQYRAEAVRSVLTELAGSVVSTDETGVWLLYSQLAALVTQDPEGSDSVYDALCGGVSSSRGVALSFEALCGLANIPCETVRGTKDGVPYCWNIVTIPEGSFHVDVGEWREEDSFLCYDGEMLERYRWDAQAYPVCAAPDGGMAEQAEGATPSPAG